MHSSNKLVHLFFALFCASSTTILAMSEAIACCTFLFFIFDTPNLNIFGILSIVLFIISLPISDPKSFVPRSIPLFAKVEPSHFPDCCALSIFLLCFIFLKAGAA